MSIADTKAASLGLQLHFSQCRNLLRNRARLQSSHRLLHLQLLRCLPGTSLGARSVYRRVVSRCCECAAAPSPLRVAQRRRHTADTHTTPPPDVWCHARLPLPYSFLLFCPMTVGGAVCAVLSFLRRHARRHNPITNTEINSRSERGHTHREESGGEQRTDAPLVAASASADALAAAADATHHADTPTMRLRLMFV